MKCVFLLARDEFFTLRGKVVGLYNYKQFFYAVWQEVNPFVVNFNC